MAVGRISGPLLKSNLIRNGIDLAFETDLLYLDVNNQRIGVRTNSPSHDLHVNGTTRTTNLIVDNIAEIADITISGNTIQSANTLNLLTTGADSVVYQRQLDIQSISIFDNVINTNDSNANLELRPNGTGQVEVFSDLEVNGDIHATGNISADGNITLGDADTDNVTFNAEVASDIIPDVTDTYRLGNSTKRWDQVWSDTINADTITANSLVLDGVDMTLRQGNIFYVAKNGDDARTGTHPQDPFLTIGQALTQASTGDTIYIYPGAYQETFPLTVPVGVTVKGHSLRSVTITPTNPTNTNDAFLLNGETTIEDVTIKDFYSPGFAFKFANNMTVTSRSPYIRNVTVITKGSTLTAEDPRGFNAGDAGAGAYLDGSVVNASSKEASCLFHAVTFITPGVDTLQATNGVRIEWLNSFTYFANRGLYAFDGTAGKYNDGKTKIRLGGITGGTFQAGDTITFTSTDSSTTIAVTAESVNSDVITIDGKNVQFIDFDTTPQSISNGSGVTATTILNHDVRDFGAEIRMIGSASVYGNFGLYGDGPGVIVYAIGQNLAYIGNGKEVTNDPGTVLQDNEVIELNDAKIRFNTVDHKGDFRVGDLFYVNQDDGTVNFVANALNVDLTQGVTFTSGGNSTFVSGERIDTGNLRISGNTIESLSGNINISPLTQTLNLNSDVNVAGSLDVTGNVTIGGNITIGDEASDTIQIVAGIDSDLIPNIDTAYDLGAENKMWKWLYANGADLGDIKITNNFIETTVSNADLELRANGTGKVVIPNANVEVTNDFTVGGDTVLQDVDILGDLTITGDILQTGDQTIVGDVAVGGDLTVTGQAQFEEILIDDNFITTTSSNANLELRANGTGEILITNTFRTTNNLIAGSMQFNTITGTLIDATTFTNGSITIDNDNITTSNDHLEFGAGGTGDVVFNTNNVRITGDLNVTSGDTSLQNTTVNGNIVHTGNVTQTGNFNIAGEISNGNILIEDNFITTTDSNSPLELRANGTGEILVPNNDVQINNDLTVSGDTDLQNTVVNGTFTLTGDFNQTGDSNITGNVNVTQDLDVSGQAQFEEILIDDNFITTTTSNTNLELRAISGGRVLIPNNNVEITNDLAVQGTLTVNNINSSGTITANRFTTGDILIDDNFITTTLSNSNLELRANGTGEIIVPSNNVTFNNNIDVIGLSTFADTTINGTLQVVGNVTHTGNIQVLGTSTLDSIIVNQKLQLEEILIDDNFITTTSSNTDLELRAAGTGKVIVPNDNVEITNDLDVNGTFTVNNITSTGTIVANSYSTGDLLVDDNFITTTLSNSNLELRANGTGKVLIPNNNVQIDGTLDVDGQTTLDATTINGTINHVGSTIIDGDLTQNGSQVINGTLNVSGDVQYEDIQVAGNVIQTTESNSNLEIRTQAGQNILIPTSDVSITGDLTVSGQLTVGDIQSTGTIEANNFTTGDVLIDDNFITTTTSNSDLELRANGTGKVVVQDNLQATQDLTVSGTTTLNNTVDINGTVTHVGNTIQTGNFTQTGTTDITGGLTVTGDADFEGISISGNTISGTQSNADLEIKTSGSGNVVFPNNNLQVTNNFEVGDTLTVGNLTASGTIQAQAFTTGDILIDDNFITTTLSNSNLELRTAGTGAVIIDDFDINGSTITTTGGNLTVSPDTGYTIFTGTGAINIPVGTTLQRPSGVAAGKIRYNQDLNRYEGYNGTNWIILQGVEDLDGDTRVTAELVEGQNDNKIRFYTQDTVRANIDANRFYADRFEVDDVQIEQNTISTLTTDQDLVLSAAGTGRVVIENFAFEGNRIINTVSNSITQFENTNNGYVKFSGTGGLVIPSGTSAERPAVAYREIGMARFNTEDDRVEIFDGVNWASSAGAGSGINPADAADLAIETVLYLG
ncbi:MAG: hypothetical protein CBC91_04775 [Rickettsiales bacterium TMED131]|nr:MAG: hypothetical protein CBC91_04775 [Rickettsiales bacterium TMED131]